MHVELLTYTPEAQVLVACAAKLCYSASDIDSLMQKQTPEAVERFLDKLASMGHESPLEHAYFMFGIEGVSRRCWHRSPGTGSPLSVFRASDM